jgi:hypothetical protein
MMADRQPALKQLILVCPIVPGRVEAWRRFIQETAENRDEAYTESRARMAIWAEHIWIHETADAALAILVIETDQPSHWLNLMKTSEWPFDTWFRQQFLVHLGVDVGTSINKYLPELVLEWQAA